MTTADDVNRTIEAMLVNIVGFVAAIRVNLLKAS
jgi:hypothetical protein